MVCAVADYLDFAVYKDSFGSEISFGYDETEDFEGTRNPITVLASLLVNFTGILPEQIDWESFETARVYHKNREVSFAIPRSTSDAAPSMQNLIGEVCQSTLSRIHVGNDGRWKISLALPVGEEPDFLVEDEHLIGDVNFEIDYDDITHKVSVFHDRREISQNTLEYYGSAKAVSATKQTSVFIHEISRVREFYSIFKNQEDADWLGWRLLQILSGPKRTARLRVPIQIGRVEVGSTILLKRNLIPGFEYDPDVVREMTGAVIEVEQNAQSYELTIDEQRGIEDNAGSW